MELRPKHRQIDVRQRAYDGVDLLWLALIPLAVVAFLLLASALVLLVNRRRLPPTCEFVEVRGIKLHYCQKGNGPPLIIVHGSNGSSNDFRLSVMEDLSKDFRAIAFDRPGHGYSERPSRDQGPCASHAELILEAWKKLGAERPIVMGHSSAGAVLMELAVKHPKDIAGLVILSGVVHSFGGDEVPVMGLYRAIKRRYVGSALIWLLILPLGGFIGRWLLKFTFDPDPVPPRYRREGVALALRPGPLRAEAEDLECLQTNLKAVEGRYGDIDLPIVLVVGERDRNVPPEGQCVRLSSEVRGAELVLLEGTGHMPMFTRSREVVVAAHRAAELGRDRPKA